MSESHEFWWNTTINDGRTLSAEMKGPGQYCIVEKKDGSVWRIVYMTRDQMEAIGRDCVALAVKGRHPEG